MNSRQVLTSFDRFVPIYLQFKVSEGLRPLEDTEKLTSPDKPLQKIRTFRIDNGINSDPILYFKLRDKAKHAKDYQHNVLRSLHNPPSQYALYVAPLTIYIDEYNASLEVSMVQKIFGMHPFVFKKPDFLYNGIKEKLGLFPFLRGHVSIPPHEVVYTHEHYYSYSKGGTNIAWHSGERIKVYLRLSTQLENIFRYSYEEGNSMSKEQFSNFIIEFLGQDSPISRNLNPDDLIREFSWYLKDEFNITLFLLVTNQSS